MAEAVPEEVELHAKAVLDAAFRVHHNLGPGLLESVYERCLCHELQKAAVPHESQVSLPIVYGGITIEGGLRIDIHVNKQLVI